MRIWLILSTWTLKWWYHKRQILVTKYCWRSKHSSIEAVSKCQEELPWGKSRKWSSLEKKERGGGGRKKTSQNKQRTQTIPKPAYSEKYYDFELVWGETCRAHCHLPGFTRILLITSCNKAKSQHYPEVQKSHINYDIIPNVKTRKKCF